MHAATVMFLGVATKDEECNSGFLVVLVSGHLRTLMIFGFGWYSIYYIEINAMVHTLHVQ